MKKQICIGLCAFVIMAVGLLCLLQLPARAATVAYSGTCGPNVNWTLDDEGTLTISGTGEMVRDDHWIYYREEILRVVIEDGVTVIGERAFDFCICLTEVTMPDSITEICDGAFSYCHSLETVRMSRNLQSIGRNAFDNCKKLQQLSLHISLQSIGDSAFQYCESLTSISIPRGVTSIEGYTFAGCTALTTVSFADTIQNIDFEAFRDCPSLECINYGGSIREFEIILQRSEYAYAGNQLEEHPLRHLDLNTNSVITGSEYLDAILLPLRTVLRVVLVLLVVAAVVVVVLVVRKKRRGY